MNIELARENLGSDDPNIVVSALHLMKNAFTLADLPQLMPLMKHANPNVRASTAETVCYIIREKLVSNFNELAPDMRKKLGALMESLEPSIVKEISRDIFGNDELRRIRAVQTLGLLRKNPQVRNVLAKLVTDKSEKIRATAIILLGKIVGPNDQEIILSLLTDKDKRVRANTVEALENLGNKRMIPILLRFRKDPNNRIRGNVLKALYTLGKMDIESDLLEMIESDNDLMNASALWVISQTSVNSKKIEDASGHCLISENEMILRNAKNALSALCSPRAEGYLQYLCKENY